MTRQPSTRTAEPRTAAGRDLLATAYLAGDAASEGVSLLDAILAIEAEAADLRVPEEGEGLAPAGLDVVREALTDEDEIAHGEAYHDGGLGVCAYCGDEWPCRTQRGIDRLLARLLRGKRDDE